MPSSPFFEPDGSLAIDRILSETVPVVKLVSLFLAIALVPLVFVVFVGGSGGPGILFVILAQFVLAVGAAITLMYVIARAISLADEGPARARGETDEGDVDERGVGDANADDDGEDDNDAVSSLDESERDD